ncbi:MAG: hypothetical protein P4L92_02675 [Rudaea sp.]|nr:hypothetical protein [Rudaea sp.]
MRNLDFSSWQTLLSTLLGLGVITLIGVGIRLLAMQVIQRQRERENRQINERLRTLIAAYKTLGGSFTGNLAVDPTHLGDLRREDDKSATSARRSDSAGVADAVRSANDAPAERARANVNSDRTRRVRDSVEAALSDIVLLGTEEQVRLAAKAAAELAAGRPTHTHELVVSLRDFIRKVLDLEAVPADLPIPKQGPTRPSSGGKGGKGDGAARDEAKQGAGKGMDGGAVGGSGIGIGMGLSGSPDADDEHGHHQ